MAEIGKTWFETWFDTDYYHTLYKDRDYDEAKSFIQRLFSYIDVPSNARVLDVACGRGRHAISVSEMGFDVTGIDLSENSILYAKQFENDKVRFLKHDMCKPMPHTFDVILNLFTSIGYFEDEIKNKLVVESFWKSLAANGIGVIDFLNVHHAEQNLIKEEEKEIDGILFHIKRHFDGSHFLKEIRFTDRNQAFVFTEKVKALRAQDFEAYFKQIGIKKYSFFGNYHLEKYEAQTSKRLIIIFYK